MFSELSLVSIFLFIFLNGDFRLVFINLLEHFLYTQNYMYIQLEAWINLAKLPTFLAKGLFL